MSAKDSRHVLGPDKTVPYQVFQNKLPLQFLNEDLRKDGRTAVDLRKLFLRVGVISQAKGSAYVEVGKTKVVCGIYGPRELQRMSDFKLSGQVFCEVRFAPFSCPMRKQPQPDRQQKEMSRQLKEALEAVIILDKYPKSQIDVHITVIEDGGGMLGTCITAAGLALCHGNIDAYDLIVGTSVLWHKGVLYVDPTRQEEECESSEVRSLGSDGEGRLSIGIMPTYANGQMALVVQSGEINVDTLCEGITSAVETCHKIYGVARQVLLTYFESILEEESALAKDSVLT